MTRPLADFAARRNFTLHARGHRLHLGPRTLVMGIINLTPDSFSHDGCLKKAKCNFERNPVSLALSMIKSGADLIDVGGESTRPGSEKISVQEELQRVIPTIQRLAQKTNIPISVDTCKPEVAQRALDAGACIVNNIRGAQISTSMLKIIKKYQAAIVLMHMRKTPKTMQKNISYKDVVQEIIQKLKKSIEKCLENGIESDKIIIDPGIGFGKTLEHNLEIIRRLGELRTLKKPIVIGLSRKSFIGHLLDKDVSERLLGTAASVCAAILNGAHIIRVHDVAAMKDVAIVADAIGQKI